MNIQGELDEIRGLIMETKPESVAKLLRLADKFEPVVGLTLPASPPPGSPPAVAAKPAPAAGAAGAPPSPAAAAPPAGPAPSASAIAPAAGAVKVTPPPLAPAAPAADMEPVREALRQAKELLLVGGDMAEIARKLARALVLLNEAGNTSLDAELGGAIKATRSRDEARVRTSVDAALAALRSP
jgi:hypothetical protein